MFYINLSLAERVRAKRVRLFTIMDNNWVQI